MNFGKKLYQLWRLNSIEWSTLLSSVAHLLIDYYGGAGRSHALINITLEVTYRCQWQCNFCFLKDNVLNRPVDELTLDEIKRLVDAAAPRKLSFFLTGGEPFVRPDCMDIIRYIKEQGLKVGVNTNHALLDEKKIDQLREMGLDYIISSVHGPREVHNALTGAKNFDKVIANLKYWKARPCRTRTLINFVMTPETMQYMEDVVDIAAEVDLDILTFQHESFLTPEEKEAHNRAWRKLFNKANEVEFSHLELDPKRHDTDRMREYMARTRQRAKEKGVLVFFKPDLTPEQMGTWYSERFHYEGKCSYLYTDMRISPKGDVITCQPIPCAVGNIRGGDPFELFNSEAFVAFRRGIQDAGGLYPACARCCKLHRKF
ncbi:MAG: radical SAM/SPASM domain-containing protein [Candidatus Hydrogenedentota bacterium]